jgi:hypothetical protein
MTVGFLSMQLPLSALAGIFILGTAAAWALPGALESTYSYEENGYSPGRDLAVIDWRTIDGETVGTTRVVISSPGRGNFGDSGGRTGPWRLELHNAGSVANQNEWDAREWQWWKNYPFLPAEMRPRLVPAVGGVDDGPGGIRAWSTYKTDDVETVQEWFFSDLPDKDHAVYDCIITIRNTGNITLEEYGQIFASYTNSTWVNRKGYIYWRSDGQFVNLPTDDNSSHLNYYVTRPGSVFDQLGTVPHCPKGECVVKSWWKHPVSISHPGPNGHRHIIMVEEARTSAITQGEYGGAQDYLVYPPSWHLKAGESFTVHVRHFVTRIPQTEFATRIPQWWSAFAAEHTVFRGYSRPTAGFGMQE